jgi:hypothetical protein
MDLRVTPECDGIRVPQRGSVLKTKDDGVLLKVLPRVVSATTNIPLGR